MPVDLTPPQKKHFHHKMDNMNEDTTTNEDRAAAIGNWIKEVAVDMRDKAISTLEEFADTVQDNPRYFRDILEDNPLYLGLLLLLFLMGFGLFVLFLMGIGIFSISIFLLSIYLYLANPEIQIDYCLSRRRYQTV